MAVLLAQLVPVLLALWSFAWTGSASALPSSTISSSSSIWPNGTSSSSSSMSDHSGRSLATTSSEDSQTMSTSTGSGTRTRTRRPTGTKQSHATKSSHTSVSTGSGSITAPHPTTTIAHTGHNTTTKFNYTGGDFPTTCGKAPPSSSYWFRPAIFGYHRTNSCLYEYCRAEYATSFPASSDLAALRRTTTGSFATMSVVTQTYQYGNITKTYSTNSYYRQLSTKTLSSEAAWWGGGGKAPCCDHCHVTAGTLDMYYWPPSTSGQPATVTAVREGNTFISPSVYVVFNTIWAEDGCSQVGQDHSGNTISFAPEDISSVVPVSVAATDPLSDGFERRPFDWDAYYSQDCRGKHAGSGKLHNINYSESYDNCFPRVALPTGFFTDVDPSWAGCLTNRMYYGFYDPPFAFQPATVTGEFSDPLTPGAPAPLTPQNELLTEPAPNPVADVTQTVDDEATMTPEPKPNVNAGDLLPTPPPSPEPTDSDDQDSSSSDPSDSSKPDDNTGYDSEGNDHTVDQPDHPSVDQSGDGDSEESGDGALDSGSWSTSKPTDGNSDPDQSSKPDSNSESHSDANSGTGASDPNTNQDQATDQNPGTSQDGQGNNQSPQAHDSNNHDPENGSENTAQNGSSQQPADLQVDNQDSDAQAGTPADGTHDTNPARLTEQVFVSSQWAELSPSMGKNGAVVIAGHTLTSGQGEATVSGVPIVVVSDHAVYAGNTLIGMLPETPLPTQSGSGSAVADGPQPTAAPGGLYSIDASGNIVIGSQTLDSDHASVTVSGTAYHVDSAGHIYQGTSVIATAASYQTGGGSANGKASKIPDIGEVIMKLFGLDHGSASNSKYSTDSDGRATSSDFYSDQATATDAADGGFEQVGGTTSESSSPTGTNDGTEDGAESTEVVATGLASTLGCTQWLYLVSMLAVIGLFT